MFLPLLQTRSVSSCGGRRCPFPRSRWPPLSASPPPAADVMEAVVAAWPLRPAKSEPMTIAESLVDDPFKRGSCSSSFSGMFSGLERKIEIFKINSWKVKSQLICHLKERWSYRIGDAGKQTRAPSSQFF